MSLIKMMENRIKRKLFDEINARISLKQYDFLIQKGICPKDFLNVCITEGKCCKWHCFEKALNERKKDFIDHIVDDWYGKIS